MRKKKRRLRRVVEVKTQMTRMVLTEMGGTVISSRMRSITPTPTTRT